MCVARVHIVATLEHVARVLFATTLMHACLLGATSLFV